MLLEIDILAAMQQVIQTTCAINGREEVDKMCFILTVGVGVPEFQRLAPGSASNSTAEHLPHERLEINARYIGMYFCAYQLLKDALAMRLRVCEQERDEYTSELRVFSKVSAATLN